MKDRIYDLSFEEANKFLNFKFPDMETFIKLEKAFYSLQKRLKKHNWEELVGNRFSWLFIKELTELHFEERLSIINEIEYLENPEQFKSHSKDTQVSTKGLKGLHYKHYIQGGFITLQKLYFQKYADKKGYREEINEIILLEAKNSDQQPLHILGKVFKEYFYDHFLMRLGVEDEATLKLRRRLEAEGKPIRKLTGEYIIFHQYENKNYYLALWKHKDKKQDSSLYDIEELKKAREIKMSCKNEFPEFSDQILLHI
jgi:hypothetical protein